MQNTSRPVVQAQMKEPKQYPGQRASRAQVCVNPNKQYLPQQVPALSQSERAKKPYEDFKLKKYWEDLYMYLYPQIFRHMKKCDRESAGKMMLDMLNEGDDLIISAEYNKNMRFKLYRSLDDIQKRLRRRIYMAERVKILPTKKYEESSKLLVTIGNIIGGLLKSL